MEGYAYYNGVFAPADEIRVPLTDRALFFGDGVYDAAVGYRGRIYRYEDHMARLLGNARRVGLPLPVSECELREIIQKVCAECATPFFLYIQLSRYSDERVHAYPDTERVNLLVMARKFAFPDKNSKQKLITVNDERHTMCDVKTLCLLPAVLAAKEAERHGATEAVFHRGVRVTECAHSNIAIILRGEVVTHPLSPFILPGVTRARMIASCARLGIPVRERAFTLPELFSADEVMITSTTKVALAAESVDGVAVGGREPELLSSLIGDMRAEVSAEIAYPL